jgi:hypothetical protein
MNQQLLANNRASNYLNQRKEIQREEKETRQLSDPHLNKFKFKKYQQQQPSVNSAAGAATTAR